MFSELQFRALCFRNFSSVLYFIFRTLLLQFRTLTNTHVFKTSVPWPNPMQALNGVETPKTFETLGAMFSELQFRTLLYVQLCFRNFSSV